MTGARDGCVKPLTNARVSTEFLGAAALINYADGRVEAAASQKVAELEAVDQTVATVPEVEQIEHLANVCNHTHMETYCYDLQAHTHMETYCYSPATRGVVVRERGGTPFWQIFWSRNGAPANIVGHRWNANTEAFRQITSYSSG